MSRYTLLVQLLLVAGVCWCFAPLLLGLVARIGAGRGRGGWKR